MRTSARWQATSAVTLAESARTTTSSTCRCRSALPELRIDPLSGLRVLVAAERDVRPGARPEPRPRRAPDPVTDPFGEGNEQDTPPELYAVRPTGTPTDGPGWRVRVVANRFPALRHEDAEIGGDPLAQGRGDPDLFASAPAAGDHEVVIHGPGSVASLLELGPEGLGEAMEVWRVRMRAHAESPYVHLIVNEGVDAGSSIDHSHAQLLALPFVPAAVARERERFTAYFQRTEGRNLLADVLQEEVRRGERIVAIGRDAVAICPFASRSDFHVQIVPRAARARFEDDGETGAATLHESLLRLESALGGLPPLNLWIRTAPAGASVFCWRIDVVPRLAQPAGLELGAGVQLCSVSPEHAARQLRDAPLP